MVRSSLLFAWPSAPLFPGRVLKLLAGLHWASFIATPARSMLQLSLGDAGHSLRLMIRDCPDFHVSTKSVPISAQPPACAMVRRPQLRYLRCCRCARPRGLSVPPRL